MPTPTLPTHHHPLATSPPTHHVKYVNVTFLFLIFVLFCETRAEEDVDDVIEENNVFFFFLRLVKQTQKKELVKNYFILLSFFGFENKN